MLDSKNYNLLKDNLKVKIDNFVFGGIDLVKVNNDILLILEDKKIIFHKETIEIFKEAERAGGMLVGGYNIIILEVRILDTLIEKNVITVEEGQDIVDKSKFLDVTTIH